MSDKRVPARRRATQNRSKATVQKILDAATGLIVEEDPRGVTMSEIAKRSGVVIGSLYQYFADRSAICRAILIRHHAEARAVLHHHVSTARTFEEFVDALNQCFDVYFLMLQTDRLIVGLWALVQSDPELQALDLEDGQANARYLTAIAGPLLPGVDSDRLTASFVMLMQFSFYAGRLSRDMPASLAQHVPESLKAACLHCLLALQRPQQA